MHGRGRWDRWAFGQPPDVPALLYNEAMVRLTAIVLASALVVVTAAAQTPQPFPRPGAAPPPPAPTAPAPGLPSPAGSTPARVADATAATLGFPIHPTAQLLASYDAGRGQRYYIFGATTPYAELVAYYRAELKDRGDQVFEEPPTHMFEIGRFRRETMAFPPGVTIKDWTWGGSPGYPNPAPGAQPPRFPTIIMMVPAPPGPPA